MSAATRQMFERTRRAFAAELFGAWSSTPWPLAERCRIQTAEPVEVRPPAAARPSFGAREVLRYVERREGAARVAGDSSAAAAYADVASFIRGPK